MCMQTYISTFDIIYLLVMLLQTNTYLRKHFLLFLLYLTAIISKESYCYCFIYAYGYHIFTIAAKQLSREKLLIHVNLFSRNHSYVRINLWLLLFQRAVLWKFLISITLHALSYSGTYHLRKTTEHIGLFIWKSSGNVRTWHVICINNFPRRILNGPSFRFD